MTPASFKAMVKIKQDGCWIWKGHHDRDATARMDGKMWGAHRASYSQHGGAIPDGTIIHRTCRHRPCVNPWHLEPTSHFENTMRSILPPTCNARKARCQHGHAFDKGTTHCRGHQCSRACHAAAVRRHKAKPISGCPQLSLQWGTP